jgi:hypothetical protein
LTLHAAGAKQTLRDVNYFLLLKWEYIRFGAQIISYLWVFVSCKKSVGANLKGIPNGIRISKFTYRFRFQIPRDPARHYQRVNYCDN